MYKKLYFLVMFLLSSSAVFTQDKSRLTTVTKLHQMVDNLPIKKMDMQTRVFLFFIQPVMQPITAMLNGENEILEKTSCQRDINNFLFNATEALTQEEKDAVIRNFVDRYESCEKYLQNKF